MFCKLGLVSARKTRRTTPRWEELEFLSDVLLEKRMDEIDRLTKNEDVIGLLQVVFDKETTRNILSDNQIIV